MAKETEIINKTTVLVTVCVSTYNRQNLLPDVLDSVLAQTYKQLDIIIVDDSSIDETENIAKRYCQKDERIRYFRHKKNKGLAAARNTAIFNARGKYFTFIDDDDQWVESFVEKFVSLAEQYDENWCFCCGCRYIDSLGRAICVVPQIEGKLIDYLKKGYTPPVAAQFYFTSMLIRLGGYDERVKNGVDHDLWLTLAFNGSRIKSLEQCLAIPNTKLKYGRMTTDIAKRKAGIEESLQLWKPKFLKYEGNDFYLHFAKSYRLYLDVNFFINAIRQKDIFAAFRVFVKSKFKRYCLMRVLTFLVKQTQRRKYGNLKYKPTFLSFS
jgi:glycosyltransferase involved in cell wall biosynthesis